MVNREELREMMQQRVEEILLAVEMEKSRKEEYPNQDNLIQFRRKRNSSSKAS